MVVDNKNNTENESMDDVFSDIISDENEQLQVAKELFTEEGLKMKTDLDSREVHGIAKLSFIASEFDIPSLNNWVNEFIKLRVSLKRKGRSEFIQAIKRNHNEMGSGRFGGIFGRNRGL